MLRAIPLSAAFLLLILAGAAGAAECRYSSPRNMDLESAGLQSLVLKLGETDVRLRGVPGLSKVEVRATACASNPRWLDQLQIDTSRGGGRATITLRTGDHDDFFSLLGFSSYAYLKMTVSVPAELAVRIESGSGDIVGEALASLDVDSGSGDLKAHDIAGALALTLGSGDVDAARVGSVDLRSTGSGDVTVTDVRGDVYGGRDGSGDLHFSNVGGGVWLSSIGSGDVSLENIGRDVHVDNMGSGDVTVDDVGGNLEVASDGSGDVRYHGVKGTISVPKENGD